MHLLQDVWKLHKFSKIVLDISPFHSGHDRKKFGCAKVYIYLEYLKLLFQKSYNPSLYNCGPGSCTHYLNACTYTAVPFYCKDSPWLEPWYTCVYALVITPPWRLGCVYKPDARGRAAPEGRWFINCHSQLGGVIIIAWWGSTSQWFTKYPDRH